MTQDTPAAAAAFETRIETIVNGGAGLGRLEGRVVFVPGTAPGELVRARVVREKKGFVEAELVEVLEPSPDRIEPPLGEIGSASGCDLQHLSLDAQRRIKAAVVDDCFRRQAKLELGDRLSGPDAVGEPLGYRNKIRLTRDPAGRWGVIRKGSHDVLPVERHGLMGDAFNDAVLPWMTLLPPMEQAVVRFDADGGWLISLYGPPARLKLLKAVLKGVDGPPAPGCVGLLFNNRPVWGRDHLLMKLAGRTWRVNQRSFFQTNFAVTEHALGLAGAWLDEAGVTPDAPGALLLDLYGGVGLFGLALGERFRRIVGVEEDETAVPDARNNYARDAALADRADVLRLPVDKATLAWKMSRPGEGAGGRPRDDGPHAVELARASTMGRGLEWSGATVVVDPPRAGLGTRVVNDLIELAPPRIVSMSCDPATLARDCRGLVEGGYEVTRVHVLDMFPQTSHIETLAELVRTP